MIGSQPRIRLYSSKMAKPHNQKATLGLICTSSFHCGLDGFIIQQSAMHHADDALQAAGMKYLISLQGHISTLPIASITEHSISHSDAWSAVSCYPGR